MAKWTTADIPDQTGRVAVITGANTGLGYETARHLPTTAPTLCWRCAISRRARTPLPASPPQPPRRRCTPGARPDVAGLHPRRGRQLRSDHDRIDLLINNAGVMYTPKSTTKDGFELQFGTNHLGHFALTGLLLDRLLPVAGSRDRDGQQHRPPHPRRHPLRRSAVGAQLQPGLAPTGRPSWPTCCSPTNCNDGCPARDDDRRGRPPRRLETPS